MRKSSTFCSDETLPQLVLVNFQTYFSDQEIEVQLRQTGFVLFFSVCFVFFSENCPCAFGFAILVAQEEPL